METSHATDRIPSTDHYVVFGNPIAHSKSPLIHSIFAEQTGQSMQYQTRLAALDGFAQSVHELILSGAKGANVTLPFKLEAYALCTQLSARAKLAGAVNTLSFEGGEILGENTDGIGLVTDIVENAGFSLKKKDFVARCRRRGTRRVTAFA